MLKKYGFYLLFTLVIFAGQFLRSHDLATGPLPAIEKTTLQNAPALSVIDHKPGIIYFWAEWCGVCRLMQSAVSAVAADQPVLSIALRSGDDTELQEYLTQHQLSWPVINDRYGDIAKNYGVKAVPAVFFTDASGNIVFNSSGYTSEWGLRIRLWLASLV